MGERTEGASHLTLRGPTGATDLAAIAALIQTASPLNRHRLDYPWRLSSLAQQTEDDARLWTDAGGAVIGFAAWYQPWATLDLAIRPGPDAVVVAATIFAWAAARFRLLDAARGYPLPYWVEAHADDYARLALLARHGFTLDDDYHYVMLRRPLAAPIAPPVLPAGFVIRPLAGAHEVVAYVMLHRAVFESTAMTADWRRRTLQMPQHRAALDLVLVAPDGTLAGFSVGWFAPADRTAQIEPFGIAPAFRRRGLGRALLTETLRQLQMHGADQAQVETESTRAFAQRAYQDVGFQAAERALRKGQWFSARQ